MSQLWQKSHVYRKLKINLFMFFFLQQHILKLTIRWTWTRCIWDGHIAASTPIIPPRRLPACCRIRTTIGMTGSRHAVRCGTRPMEICTAGDPRTVVLTTIDDLSLAIPRTAEAMQIVTTGGRPMAIPGHQTSFSWKTWGRTNQGDRCLAHLSTEMTDYLLTVHLGGLKRYSLWNTSDLHTDHRVRNSSICCC